MSILAATKQFGVIYMFFFFGVLDDDLLMK